MALRNQPYIPLYVQDFLTDEKLIECSAESTGVYIRLMCIMHKSETYGTVLLKQKDKQTDKQVYNFALKLAKQMPYKIEVIESAIAELLNENVIYIDKDTLCQKRMIKDNEISNIRAEAGSKGGKNSRKKGNNFAKAKPKAKHQANSEYENEYENDNEIINSKLDLDILEIVNYLNQVCNKNYKPTSKKTKDLIKARFNEKFTVDDFKTVIDKKSQDKYFIENDYLRPETLFGTKFESYLNQHIKTIEDKKDYVEEAIKNGW